MGSSPPASLRFRDCHTGICAALNGCGWLGDRYLGPDYAADAESDGTSPLKAKVKFRRSNLMIS